MNNEHDSSHFNGLVQRKVDHIELTGSSQTSVTEADDRFNYEPLFFTHPKPTDRWATNFLGFELDAPFWISSMTGGTVEAKTINENLARLCGKYKLGMGLGSCRPLLEGHERAQDFRVRRFLGDQPLFANLGIAQLHSSLEKGQENKVHQLVEDLEATGLIIHINPLQEWFQPGGDRFTAPPLETIRRFVDGASYPVIVKEVGQGMGPRSLKALLDMNIAGIEFGAFGGTNFTLLESLRQKGGDARAPFIQVGHTALEMAGILNALPVNGKSFIISGGMSNVLDGFEVLAGFRHPAVIGMASAFLTPARKSFEELESFYLDLKEALLVARGLLTVREDQ